MLNDKPQQSREATKKVHNRSFLLLTLNIIRINIWMLCVRSFATDTSGIMAMRKHLCLNLFVMRKKVVFCVQLRIMRVEIKDCVFAQFAVLVLIASCYGAQD